MSHPANPNDQDSAHVRSAAGFGSARFFTLNTNAAVDLGPRPVLRIEYELAVSSLPPSALRLTAAVLPPPDPTDDQRGLILCGKLPNWVYAHLVIECRRFAWVACENPHLQAMFPADQRHGDGWAVVVHSQRESLAPGSVLQWQGTGADAVCRRLTTAAADQAAAQQVEPIVTLTIPTGSDTEDLVYVQAPTQIDPCALATLSLPPLPTTSSPRGLTLTNARPTWLNAAFALLATASERYRYVAIFNPRTVHPQGDQLPGSVVVSSTVAETPIGTVIDNGANMPIGNLLDPRHPQRNVAGLAIGVIGLPNSGKSVFTRAMFALTENLPRVFSIEANPDGQGRYFQQVVNEYYDRIRYRWEFTDDLGEHYSRQVAMLRSRLNILWVGLGGRPSPQAQQTLQSCSHAILLRRKHPDADDQHRLQRWQQLCSETNTPILADLVSDFEAMESTIDAPRPGLSSSAAPGAMCGVVGRLQRGEPQSTDRCRVIAAAILQALMPPLQQTDPDVAMHFQRRINELQHQDQDELA